MALEVTKLY